MANRAAKCIVVSHHFQYAEKKHYAGGAHSEGHANFGAWQCRAVIQYGVTMSTIHDTIRVFDDGGAVKPANYPEFQEYVEAIRESYWVHTEFTFSGDIQDFRTNTTETERSIIRKTMLAISQIEVKVKSFWSDIHETLPHAEIGAVGATFAESEVRHMDAYSTLLDKLGLQDAFEELDKVPAIQDRLAYLDDSLRGAEAQADDKREYVRSLLLFSTFVEHVSLFSQFLIMTSFDKHRKQFKGIANAVSATSKEEQIHGLFGQDVVRTIQDEYPGLFDESFEAEIQAACERAYEAEMGILDWIFSEGELDFLPRSHIEAFLKDRFNQSLDAVNIETVFEPDDDLLAETQWFRDDMLLSRDNDFFAKTATNYTKHTQDVRPEALF